MNRIAGYKTHPAADLLPMASQSELADLVEDIRKNGLLDEIVVLNDAILDGRNRAKACVIAGVDPRFTQYEGDDPIAFVWSKNIPRRNLSPSQRAMMGERFATYRQGRPPEKGPAEPFSKEATLSEAAALTGVGRESIKRAKRVRENGVPELAEAVEQDRVAVSAAADVAELPHEQQREVLRRAEGNPRAVRRALNEVKREMEPEPEPEEGHASPTTISTFNGFGDPPKPVHARTVKALEEDEEILAVYYGPGGESPSKTATLTGVKRSRVHDALVRAGVQGQAKDPLRGMRENAVVQAATWEALLSPDAEIVPWRTATEDQRASAAEALRAMVKVANRVIKEIER